MTVSEKILNTIQKYSMLKNGDKVLVGLSGGADSVCLLLGLLNLRETLNIYISAAHINHMLRGEDAEADMNFVINLCKEKNVKLHLLKKDINEYSKENKCSLEEGGRIIRYEFFNKIADEENSVIATAHTKDDNAENFFISSLRGTRISGVPPKRGNIIRPLIEVSKKEIYEYLKEQNQTFCVDKSNFTEDYFRNKVRLKLIPYINSEFETDISENLFNNLEVMFQENEYLTELTENFIDENCKWENKCAILNIAKFSSLHLSLKRRILREIYYKISNSGYISFTHIDNIIKLINSQKTGKKLTLCDNVVAKVSYNKLIIGRESETKSYNYSVNSEETLNCGNFSLLLSPNKESKLYFYSDDLFFTVRTRKNGDKILLSDGHHKKLSDFFTDKKIDRKIRDTLPIILDTHGICAVYNKYLRKEKRKNKIYIHIKGEQ